MLDSNNGSPWQCGAYLFRFARFLCVSFFSNSPSLPKSSSSSSSLSSQPQSLLGEQAYGSRAQSAKCVLATGSCILKRKDNFIVFSLIPFVYCTPISNNSCSKIYSRNVLYFWDAVCRKPKKILSATHFLHNCVTFSGSCCDISTYRS